MGQAETAQVLLRAFCTIGLVLSVCYSLCLAFRLFSIPHLYSLPGLFLSPTDACPYPFFGSWNLYSPHSQNEQSWPQEKDLVQSQQSHQSQHASSKLVVSVLPWLTAEPDLIGSLRSSCSLVLPETWMLTASADAQKCSLGGLESTGLLSL